MNQEIKPEASLPRDMRTKKFLWVSLFVILSLIIGYFSNIVNPVTMLLFFGGYFPWVGIAVIAFVETLIFEFIFKKIFADKTKFLLWIMFLTTIFGFLILPSIINRVQVWGTQTKESSKLNQQQNYDFTKKSMIYTGKTQVSDLKVDGDKVIWASNISKSNDAFGISQLNLFQFDKKTNTGSLAKVADLGKNFGYTAQIVNNKIYWIEKQNLNQGQLFEYDINSKQSKQISEDVASILGVSENYLLLNDSSLKQKKVIFDLNSGKKTSLDFIADYNDEVILGENSVYFLDEAKPGDLLNNVREYLKRYDVVTNKTETIIGLARPSSGDKKILIAATDDYVAYVSDSEDQIIVKDVKNKKDILSLKIELPKADLSGFRKNVYFDGKIVDNKLFYESNYSGKISILNLQNGEENNLDLEISGGMSSWDTDGSFIVNRGIGKDFMAEVYLQPVGK